MNSSTLKGQTSVRVGLAEIGSKEDGVKGELSSDCRSRAKTKVLVRVIHRTSQKFSNRGRGKQTEKREYPRVQRRLWAFKRCCAGVGEVKERKDVRRSQNQDSRISVMLPSGYTRSKMQTVALF